MLRLHFGVKDLARTKFAPPRLLCEVIGGAQAMQQPGSPFQRKLRANGLRIPLQARPLLEIVPAYGWVPEFLTPEAYDAVDEALQRTQVAPVTALPAWTKTGRPTSTSRRLRASGRAAAPEVYDQAIRAFHKKVLQPLWPQLQRHASAELNHRAWQLTTQGAEETLNDLYPEIRWVDGALEVQSPVDADLDLADRGLCLVPSAVWTRAALDMNWGQPVLTYPARPAADQSQTSADGDGLGALMGSTRARVLRALVREQLCTSGLAAAVGISVSCASTHAAALRAAGLVASVREGQSVRHQLTELGRRVASKAA